MKKVLLLLLLNIAFQIRCYGQSSHWVHYGDETWIQDFAIEGSKIWIASSQGVIEFDTLTKQSTLYNHHNSGLPSDWVYKIVIDSNRVKWINSLGVLVRFDGINWISLTPSNSGIIMTSGVQSLAIDSLNRLWIGGAAGELSIYDGTTWVNYQSPVSNGSINQIVFHDTTAWLATSFGLTKFEGINWTNYTTVNSSISGNDIERISIDSIGLLWIACSFFSDHYLNCFDGATFTIPVFPPPSCTTANLYTDYRKIAFDSLNNFLFFNGMPVTQEKVLFKSDGVNCSYSDPVPVLKTEYQDEIMKYINGSVWLLNEVLNQYDGNYWTIYNYKTNPLSSTVSTIANDSSDLYWFGVTNGICSFDGTNWTSYKFADSLPLTAAVSIVIDSSGLKWIATSEGLLQFDGNAFTYYLPGLTINALKLDSLEHLWITTENNGVYYFDGINFVNYNSTNSGLSQNCVLSLEIDNSGTLWFGTLDSGLCRFDGMSWINYNPYNSPITDNLIQSIKCDSSGGIWVGTESGGICKKVGNNWVCYTDTNSALLCNQIQDLEIDPYNNLYISSTLGVQIFDGINWTTINDSSFGFTPVISYDILFDRFGNTVYAGYRGVDFYSNGDLIIDHNSSIIGKVYYDANSNGIEDSLDKGMFNQKVVSYPDSITAFTNSYGNYAFGKKQGNYTVGFDPQPNWLLTSDSASYTINLGPVDQTGFDFGTYPFNPFDSISLSITSGLLRCDHIVPFWINYTNDGTSLFNGIIKLKIDTAMSYSYSNPIPDSIIGDTLIWNFNNLYPGEQRIICAYLVAPSVNSVGQQINYTGIVETQNGVTLNTANYQSIVFCSFDPNDKLAEPIGYSANHFTHFNDSIEYTIRFQNCGNDTAFRIKIVDTLDSFFDKNSFRILASSHPVYTSLTTQGAITFRFDSIMLPCKTTNEPLSQGFVKYSVLHKQGLADPTIVKNYASIYFDANPPIITNETFNTLSDIFAGINSIKNKNDKLVSIYPNPANQYVTIVPGKTIPYSLAIYDALGNIQFATQNLAGTKQLDLSKIRQGIYFFKVIYKNGESCDGKLVLIH